MPVHPFRSGFFGRTSSKLYLFGCCWEKLLGCSPHLLRGVPNQSDVQTFITGRNSLREVMVTGF